MAVANPDSSSSSAWTNEFDSFLSAEWEEEQLKKQRMATAVSFLNTNTDKPLDKRVAFLQFKGLSRDEIEEAFEVVGNDSDLVEVMEGCPSGQQVAVKPASQPKGETPPGAGPKPRTEGTPFHEKEHILIFAEGSDYYPGVVVAIDETRHDDVLKVRWDHIVQNPMRGKEQWMVPGFKGVVSDIIPRPDTVNVGDHVLASNADQDACDVFHDAVVLEENTENSTVDIEYNDTTRRFGVQMDEIRTLMHPRTVAVLSDHEVTRRKREDAIRKQRVGSTPSFPTKGSKERPVRTAELMALMKGEKDARNVKLLVEDEEVEELTVEERGSLGTFIRSFIRYPQLDIDEAPRMARRYQDFLYTYGERERLSNQKSMPHNIPSQKERNGKGFGFDLSHQKRHPHCPYLFEYNPILEVAHQCIKTNQMFIDPDFPPSFESLHGPWNSYDSRYPHEGTPARDVNEFEWRRVSEVVHHPRARIAQGTSSIKLARGHFAPQWLCAVFGLLDRSEEFDEMFSPAEETCLFGCYSVRIFVDGEWWFVLLDDFIPVYKRDGRPACTLSINPNELWPILLEKVYAKLEGSYWALLHPRPVMLPERVFEDLTGGLAVRDQYSLMSHKEGWFENIRGKHEEREHCSVLSAAPTVLEFNERKYLKLGIGPGTYHYLQDLVCIVDGTGEAEQQYKFIQTWNPWIEEPIKSVAQETVLKRFKRHITNELLERREEGEDGEDKEKKKKERSTKEAHDEDRLWLPFDEYMNLFSGSISLFSLNNWQKAVFHGSFKGRSGGSKWESNNSRWQNNPQYYINLVNYAEVAIQLSLCDRRFTFHPVAGKMLTMTLCEREGFETQIASSENTIVSSNSIDFQDDYVNDFPSVYIHMSLNSGGYVLVPEIGTENSDEEFVLKVWASSMFQVRPMHEEGLASAQD